ncbi:hypothetical protein BGZ98_000997 [Dissophora globulifera]|nr:hypothetical protein BGZ98_000997 [Dissophora globulifera]
MAQCYSTAGSAPLNALANRLLGESSFSSKSSLFRSALNHPPQQQSQLSPQHRNSTQNSGLFPRQLPQLHQQQQQQHHQISHKTSFETLDSFEHAWSASTSHQHHLHHHLHQPLARRVEPTFSFKSPYNLKQQQDIPDLDLISAWEHHHQHQQQQHQQSAAGDYLHPVQTTLSGIAATSRSDLSVSEFESFRGQPASNDPGSTLKEHNTWAQEWSRDTQDETEDDDDEFREEWNNDHFTQAYINSHQSQFRAIEEQDRIKEARLEEERERRRQASGGPPRSAWMMAGSATTTATENIHQTQTVSDALSAMGPRRLRVPGVDSFDEPSLPMSAQQGSLFSVDEFMEFNLQQTPEWSTRFQNQPTPKPVRADDRFMSLVSDLHLAEQIFYPGASSATLPELSDHQGHLSAPAAAIIQEQQGNFHQESGWANEFAVGNDQQTRQQRQYIGAEWSWERLFGKNPRKQLLLATEASTAAASAAAARGEELDEGARLKAVALSRLQALFGHLSLAPPTLAP